MRWINHQACTMTTVYALTGNGVATILAWAGAVIPDALELPLQGLARHRGTSHWPYPYLLAAGAAAGAWFWSQDPLYRYLAWFLAGALLHLAQDLLSPGGIPLRWPARERFGLDWYVPFGWSETVLVLVWCVLALLVAAWRGALNPGYIRGEVERSVLVLSYLGWRVAGK